MVVSRKKEGRKMVSCTITLSQACEAAHSHFPIVSGGEKKKWNWGGNSTSVRLDICQQPQGGYDVIEDMFLNPTYPLPTPKPVTSFPTGIPAIHLHPSTHPHTESYVAAG